MPYLERKGKPTLHYLVDDFTDPWKNAPYLVLQHGFSRSHKVWYSWVPYLARFFKVVRPDLRGLGLSSRDFDLQRDLNLAAYLDDFSAVVGALGGGPVHYCGESMGGILGMAFAAERPDLFRTLTIVSSPMHLHGKDEKASAYGHGTRAEALRKMGARGWAEASNAGRRFPPDADPGMMKWFVDEMGKSDVEVLVATYEYAHSIDLMPYLWRIKMPMLGLYPMAGTIAGDDQIDILKANVPHAQVLRVAARAHAINTIAPAACATALLHFAAQHDGTACRE